VTSKPTPEQTQLSGSTPTPFNPEAGARPSPEYTLLKKLGEGGFGQVWKAHDNNGFEVALKFIQLDQIASDEEVRELEVMKKFGHANLLVLHRYWSIDNWLVVALELAQGTLLDRLRAAEAQGQAGIPFDELLEYMRDAARGLDYLHSNGIQHRDVKPENLMLVGGSVKVADFGLAKKLEHSLPIHTLVLSPPYASPEQCQQELSPHSDQYSLAVSYCELRSGRRPFRGKPPRELMFDHVSKEPDLTILPAAERLAVSKALAKNPDHRWPSCRAFVEALSRPEVYPAPPVTNNTPSRLKRWLSAVLVLPIGTLKALATLVRPKPKPRSLDTSAQALIPSQRENPPTQEELNLKPLEPVTLPAGGEATLTVSVRRKNSTIRVELAVTDLPAGVAAAPAFLEAGADSVGLILTAAADANAVETQAKVIASAGAARSEGRFRLAVTPEFEVRERPNLLDCTGEAGVSAADIRKAQQAWAAHLGRRVEETVEIAQGVKMEFVLVPPGKFGMGSPNGEKDREGFEWSDETLHTVSLTEPFYLGKYEVTQAQYEALTRLNPSKFKGADHPVEGVSWEDAEAYCRMLTKKRAGMHWYRLPTEAEWEYSCRGGRPSSKPFGVGDDGESLSWQEANFDGNFPYGTAGKGLNLEVTCKVGSYKANALGLCDMHGNVWEWCADKYGAYPRGNTTNPTGPGVSEYRVIRGGDWNGIAGCCRAANRGRNEPGDRDNSIGFRVALVPSRR
jgi:formylglycine-generating enzyme required for sulfatase activity/serine/threonine protein kinase